MIICFELLSLLAYFGFLRSAELTVLSLSFFDPSSHLSVCDIAVDVALNLYCVLPSNLHQSF